MLTFGGATRVYLAAGATDLRKGCDGLSALAARVIGADPLSGRVFVFCNRDRTRLKVLFWDGSGYWTCAKRLQRGRFSWPSESVVPRAAGEAVCGRVELGAREFAMLAGGIGMRRAGRKRRRRPEGDAAAARAGS